MFITCFTYDVRIDDIIEDNHVALTVRVMLLESGGTFGKVNGPLSKHIHEGQPSRRTETGPSVMHNALSPSMLCGDLVHTAAVKTHTPLSILTPSLL